MRGRLEDAARRCWRLLLGWRFRLFQRHRHGGLTLETVAGRPILVLPRVFNPRLFRTGEFLVETLDERWVPPGSTVLDMGTGSGVGAVFAARWARRVVAVDVNPEAVRCTRINALLNEVDERVEAREGDLFGPVAGERFDVVLFNPPFFRGEPRDDLEGALWAEDVVERFAAGLAAHLTADGHAMLVLSSDGDVEGFLRTFRQNGFRCRRIAERDLVNETLTVHDLTL
jgi:release factor glutamine methyltransferase